MADRPPLDLLIKNVRVVRPHHDAVETRDVGVRDGRFVRVEPEIPAGLAREIHDAHGQLGFPGVVDAHTHVGIYAPLHDDAVTESQAAVTGGVTTVLTYFRTGQYYLNRGGPYATFYPDVLAASRDRYWCDYAYHLAPIQASHVDEMEWLATQQGVPSFKIFMFYGGHGLHGQADRAAQRRFLMVDEDESYDFAHFEFIMRAAARIRQAHPRLAPHVSVSLHCEIADILNAYTQRVARAGALTGLRAYSAARPPHAEGLAVWIAGYLAHETDCPGINLLHLSSRKGVEAALALPRVFPHLDVRREVTVGHLLLDCDAPTGVLAKVNPPIRPREDVEFPVAGAARAEARLGGERPRLLRPRDEGGRRAPGRHLAGALRLRRHRVPPVGRRQRGAPAWDGIFPHGGGARLEPGAALRPPAQGGHRPRL
jgi:allantoinase